MKIHPGEERVRLAEHNIGVVVDEMISKHSLTEAETIQVVTQVMSRVLLSVAKYAIRKERHGNTDKPGGIE